MTGALYCVFLVIGRVVRSRLSPLSLHMAQLCACLLESILQLEIFRSIGRRVAPKTWEVPKPLRTTFPVVEKSETMPEREEAVDRSYLQIVQGESVP